MLYHYDRMTSLYESLEGMEQTIDVVEVKSRSRLVEDEQCGHWAL